MAIGTLETKTVTGASKSVSRQFQGMFSRVIFARLVVKETSLGAGLSSSGAFTVPGAQLGDFVLVAPRTDLGDDVVFSAQVTATDEVTLILSDATEAANTSANADSDVNIVVLGVDDNMFVGAASW